MPIVLYIWLCKAFGFMASSSSQPAFNHREVVKAEGDGCGKGSSRLFARCSDWVSSFSDF